MNRRELLGGLLKAAAVAPVVPILKLTEPKPLVFDGEPTLILHDGGRLENATVHGLTVHMQGSASASNLNFIPGAAPYALYATSPEWDAQNVRVEREYGR